MEWLDQLTAKRRAEDPLFAESEARIGEEGGGYKVELVGDASGHPLNPPILVAAGDKKGVFHL